MKIKTFTGSSLPEAIKKAKREFGHNIILMESKEISAGRTKSGKKIVEITISVDSDAPQTQRSAQIKNWQPPILGQSKLEKTPQSAPDPVPRKGENEFSKVIGEILSRKPKALNQEKMILKELAELREQVSRLSASDRDEKNDGFPKAFRQVQNLLIEKGFNQTLAERLIKRTYILTEKGPAALPADIIQNLKKELRLLFKSYNFKRRKKKNGRRVILLVGATGVGKTTSAMKLAAFQEIFGKEDVVIISTDPYGPSEALKAFSKMNGTPVFEKKRIDELSGLMEKFNGKEVVIVDTPGQSPFTANYLPKLEEYVKAAKPTEIFLVLAMSGDLKDLFMASAIYMLLKPDGIILTKFDETTQPGKVFPIINEMNLPVAAICDGKRIFMDITVPKAEYVFDKLFDRTERIAHAE